MTAWLRERVEVLGPEVSLDVLRSAVGTALVDRLGITWDERYGELKRYKEQHGHCDVPANSMGHFRSLGHWVRTQRVRHAQGELPLDRKTRLDELGFAWQPLNSTWDAMLAELQRYKNRYGDCNVPFDSTEHGALGRWALKQRQRHADGKLSADRKARLDALGFVFDLHEDNWEAMFAELKRYKERFGDCDVPQKWAENPQLARWVNTQRQAMKRGTLSTERKAHLDGLGFDWGPVNSRWETMFAELKCYKNRFGDCNVPHGWEENPKLAIWVSSQRGFKKRGKLSPERVERLVSLGFAWNTRDAKWETMFAELKRYKERFDHCNVPIKWKENPQLATWVSKQRDRQRGGTLLADRKAPLDALGFEWSPTKGRRAPLKIAR